MITNWNILKNTYKCRDKVAHYLIRECKLPVLSISPEDNMYYFTNNETLKECLKRMPLGFKLQAIFTKH